MHAEVPSGAKNPIAVLSASGLDFQDNVQNVHAYQYWENIRGGLVSFAGVKPDSYRLTIYAEGIFGDYIIDDIVIRAGHQTTKRITWIPESNGVEL